MIVQNINTKIINTSTYIKASIISLFLFLGACSTPGLQVTGKDYLYPRLNPEWLEPTPKAPVPDEPVTNRELYRFILGQEEALDRCNAKVEYTRKSYEEFIANLPKTE